MIGAADAKLISIVVPCYNEEAVIVETVKRLISVCDTIECYDFELLFIDDGSTDQTRLMLRQLADLIPRIKVIGFSRNFGHQIAVSAGIDHARGDAVVLIDADLQDPPEIIRDMVSLWESGYDVVYATRTERSGESAFKKQTARLFYRLLNRLSDVPIPLDTGDFRLMARNVVHVLRKMPERDRFIRGMVSWVGFKQVALPYRREERFAGESKYPLKKMLRFATDGILSFSLKPLRLSITLGLLSSACAFLGIIYALFVRLLTNSWVEGWAGIFIAILFIGGVQLVTVGIVGEYVGRIYNEVKRRPLYLVDEVIDARTLHSSS